MGRYYLVKRSRVGAAKSFRKIEDAVEEVRVILVERDGGPMLGKVTVEIVSDER